MTNMIDLKRGSDMLTANDALLHTYIETLLWQQSCNGSAAHAHDNCRGEDCDSSLLDIGYTPDSLLCGAREAIRAELTDFINANRNDIESLGLSGEDIGQNFVLSRNRHGTGFWDRGWKEAGDRLHEAATVYGATSVYVTDDDTVEVA